MKILYILQNTHIHGGVHIAFITMLKVLLKLGIEPIVVIPNKKGLYNILSEMDVSTIVIPYKSIIYPPYNSFKRRCLYLPRIIRMIYLNRIATSKISQIIKSEKIDVIHSNSSVVGIGYEISKKTSIPHVWHIREYWDKAFRLYPNDLAIQKRLIENNSYTICTTKGVQEHCKLDNSKNSIVIGDPIKYDVKPIDINKKRKNILYVGEISYNKGIEDLIIVFAKFAAQSNIDNEFRLQIIGGGSKTYIEYCKKLVTSLNISNKVDFLGIKEDVSEYMNKAFVFVMPSHSEGFGMVTTEAMFSGALVIGYNYRGTKDQFDNGLLATGKEIALRYNTLDELLLRLNTVATNGLEFYEPMMERAQQVVAKVYSPEYHANQVLCFYKRILNK